MQKTLGGDRLGAGKRMKVNLHGYERSTHDMGYLWRSTAAPGTLIPFLVELGLPGDTFDIGLNADVKTLPSLGPLFGSFKVQLDIFQAPIRLYQGLLHNNKLGIGMDMSKVLLPQLRKGVLPINSTTGDPLTDIDNAQINPSALLSYLGLRGFGAYISDTPTQEIIREFNAIPLLAYWEIYKNYYANKQEDEGAYIHAEIEANPDNVDTIHWFDNGTHPLPGLEIGGPGNPQNAVLIAPSPDSPQLQLAYTGTLDDALNWVVFNTDGFGGAKLTYTWKELMSSWTDNGAGLVTGYINPSLLLGYYIHSWRYRTQADLGTEGPQIVRFDLANIDAMRDEILHSDYDLKFIIDGNMIPHPYGAQLRNISGVPATLSSQEGLGLKTYQSDLFNNWLKTEWLDGSTGVNVITAIDTSGGSFTLDTLNLSKKVYEMLNRIAVSGGTYDDWLDVQYTHERYTRVESPMYHGGLSKELVFQEVISNTRTSDDPLGTLAGKGVMTQKHKGGKAIVRVDEPSYIIGIVSITPRIDYSQGNKWDTQLKTMNDLHVPALDEIGFQDLITEQMAWWDTQFNYAQAEWQQFSAGKQPAWINYMTNVNQTRGNFAIENNQMFMTLNRRYEALQSELPGSIPTSIIGDLTTYIDPSKYNFIFAETKIDAQNFWVQIAVDMEARRKMSAKVMPNI